MVEEDCKNTRTSLKNKWVHLRTHTHWSDFFKSFDEYWVALVLRVSKLSAPIE